MYSVVEPLTGYALVHWGPFSCGVPSSSGPWVARSGPSHARTSACHDQHTPETSSFRYHPWSVDKKHNNKIIKITIISVSAVLIAR